MLRDDPASAIALEPDEIDWLEGFFAHSGAHVLFEGADGYFCGLIAGPGSPGLDEYLPRLWERPGEDHSGGPRYDSASQADYVLGLLTRHWKTILSRVNCDYLHQPVFRHNSRFPKATFCALGFLFAINLRDEQWS